MQKLLKRCPNHQVNMPQRKYSKEQEKVAKANPRVILPITHDMYQKTALDKEQFRHWLDEMIAQFPELFPKEIESGYTLHQSLDLSLDKIPLPF